MRSGPKDGEGEGTEDDKYEPLTLLPLFFDVLEGLDSDELMLEVDGEVGVGVFLVLLRELTGVDKLLLRVVTMLK
jgi:hypothetical protein